MKKVITLLIFFISISSISIAHSGRTDSNGGHYDSSTGEYHYHNDGSNYENELIVVDNDDDIIRDYANEISELEEKVTNKTHTIDRLNAEIDEKNSEIIALEKNNEKNWTFFIFLLLIAICIAYKIGIYKQDKRYFKLSKLVMSGLGTNDIDKAIKDTSEFYKSQGIDIDNI